MKARLAGLVPVFGICSLAAAQSDAGSLLLPARACVAVKASRTPFAVAAEVDPSEPPPSVSPLPSTPAGRYRVDMAVDYDGMWLRMVSSYRSEAEARTLVEGLHRDLARRPHRLSILRACQTETVDNLSGDGPRPPAEGEPDKCPQMDVQTTQGRVLDSYYETPQLRATAFC